MFEDAPVKSQAEAVQALKDRKIDLSLYKKARGAILGLAVSTSKWVSVLFPLQYILPLLFILPYALITKDYLCLVAILPYIAIPSLIPFNAPVAVGATAFGLFAIYLGWPGIVVCLFVPALLSYAGEQVWWGVVQVTVLRLVLQSEEAFNELWLQGGLVIKTANRAYRHSGGPATPPGEADAPAPGKSD